MPCDAVGTGADAAAGAATAGAGAAAVAALVAPAVTATAAAVAALPDGVDGLGAHDADAAATGLFCSLEADRGSRGGTGGSGRQNHKSIESKKHVERKDEGAGRG